MQIGLKLIAWLEKDWVIPMVGTKRLKDKVKAELEDFNAGEHLYSRDVFNLITLFLAMHRLFILGCVYFHYK